MPSPSVEFSIGLVVNPIAGLGGAVGLKGSDDPHIQELALQKGAMPKSGERVTEMLTALRERTGDRDVRFLTAAGPMGETWLEAQGYVYDVCFHPTIGQPTTAEDTRAAVRAISSRGVDLLVFAGGDGTARDVLDAAKQPQVVLGLPCGVKMYSGVFVVTPIVAAELIAAMILGKRVGGEAAEVRDIDESAYREGKLSSKYYGELVVPAAHEYVQATKVGGIESEPLAQEEIAAGYAESMDDTTTYVMGSGTTVGTLMRHLGFENSLLGVDVVRGGQCIAQDVSSSQLLNAIADGSSKLVVGVTGGHGFLFGRGNQQISSEVIAKVGRDHIDILATRTKLESLANQWLEVDTGDANLDRRLQGIYKVRSGYEDFLLVQVGRRS